MVKYKLIQHTVCFFNQDIFLAHGQKRNTVKGRKKLSAGLIFGQIFSWCKLSLLHFSAQWQLTPAEALVTQFGDSPLQRLWWAAAGNPASPTVTSHSRSGIPDPNFPEANILHSYLGNGNKSIISRWSLQKQSNNILMLTIYNNYSGSTGWGLLVKPTELIQHNRLEKTTLHYSCS